MHLCLFEDDQIGTLQPLVHLRAAYDLPCGMTTLRDKIIRCFPNASVTLHVRVYLARAVKRNTPDCFVNEIPTDADRVLFINGRTLADPDFAKRHTYDGEDCVYTVEDTPVAAWLSGRNLNEFAVRLESGVLSASHFSHLSGKTTEARLLTYPWELVNNNGDQLVADFETLTGGNPRSMGDVSEGARLVNPERIHLSRGAKVSPGVVLDADNGPIYLGDNSRILPNAVIEGPAFIGENSLVKVGAKIYENTSIGKVCKVGGEVEETIIHSYSNKQHDGFLGHAYLGSWVNIGAGTNNSDLKNNYGPVKVIVNGKPVDTGSMFVGLFMGDHSKSGINQMFNTGTVVGTCCNVFGPGQPPKYVPSFSWGAADGGFTTYRLDRAIEVARKVMARRNVEFTEIDEKLFQTVFDLTGEERRVADIQP